MNNISYNDTRKINAHIDYKTRETGGPWLQQLSRLPGHTPPCIYQAASNPPVPADLVNRLTRPAADGVIDVSDGLVHDIRIAVKDANGNTTILNFQVQYRPSPVITTISSPLAGKLFYPGMLDGYEAENIAFYIGEKALYDSVHIGCRIVDSAAGAASPVYAIGSTVIPLQEPLLVRIRSMLPAPPAGGRSGKEKVVMLRTEKGKKEVQRPEWLGDWASARFRDFGDFRLVEDKQPPVITPIGIREGAVLRKARRIAFRVKDDLGGLRSFRAELDPPAGGPPVGDPPVGGQGGNWLCFTNDKYLDFIYIFDEHCPAGKHVLKVTAEDVAGNRTIREYRFTR
jgi:hypothetical protein